MGLYDIYRPVNTKEGSIQQELEKFNGNFQTIDTVGGIFDIKNLKNHNDKDTLMLPDIMDHRRNGSSSL